MLTSMLKRAAVLVLVAFTGLLLTAAVASAENLAPSPTIVDVPSGAHLSISPVILAVLAGTLLPVLNGIITRTTASSGLAAFVNLVTVALFTAVNYVVTNPVFDVSTVLILFGTTFVTSITSYYGLWKPVSAGGTRAPLNGTLGFVGPKPG